eukprot:scaffold238944_cov33-Tisochrysis_lutea.AAC.6
MVLTTDSSSWASRAERSEAVRRESRRRCTSSQASVESWTALRCCSAPRCRRRRSRPIARKTKRADARNREHTHANAPPLFGTSDWLMRHGPLAALRRLSPPQHSRHRAAARGGAASARGAGGDEGAHAAPVTQLSPRASPPYAR